MTEIAYELIGSDKRKYPINSTGLTIGSQSSNDVVIQDNRVSNTHARILLANGRLWVRDENSKEGTFINGKRILGQQELHLGDKLQIGSTIYHLAKVPVAGPMRKRARLGLIIVGIATAVLFLLILLMSSSGLFHPGLTFSATPELTSTITNPIETIVPSPTNPSPTITSTPNISSNVISAFNGSISCEEVEQYKDIHTCTVSNLGSTSDILWLSFEPHRIDKTNDFNLSVILEGSQTTIYPDRKGLISLGQFEPNQEKVIFLQMICVDIHSGCPLTTVHVQLLANNGNLQIDDMQGSLDIQNMAVGKTATPTEKNIVGPTATQAPTTVQPTMTSTPSDAFGPTPTSNP